MDSLRRKPDRSIHVAPSIQYNPRPIPHYIPPKKFSKSDIFTPQVKKRFKIFSAKKRQQFFRFVAIISGSILFIALCLFGYFSWKIGSTGRTMGIESSGGVATDTLEGARSFIAPMFGASGNPLRGESDGRTNILLLGKASEGSAGQKLTDTIMVASIDFTQKKVALLSLPRDLFVEVPDRGFSTKLNAIYQYDIAEGNAEQVKKTVSVITGLPIHYFVAIDYDGFKHVVDSLGGISLYVERDLYDTRYPGPNYSYETFQISKGWQDLDGETALKYVRERHGDPDGDFGRARRQQITISAVRNKAFSLQTLLNPIAINNVIDTLGTHIRTDIPFEDLRRFGSIVRDIDTKNIRSAVVDAWKKDSLLRVSHVQVGDVAMFVLVPRTGTWNEIHDLATNIFDLDRARERKKMIEKENASIVIVNGSKMPTLAERVRTILTIDIPENHIRIADLPDKTQQESISRIFDRSNNRKPFTINELATRFGLEKTELDTKTWIASVGSDDIIIVLGDDLAKKLSFEEDTPEDIRNSESDLDYQKRLNEALIDRH